MANGCYSCSFIRIAWRHFCPVIHVWIHETIYLQTLISTHSSNVLTPLHAAQNLNICSLISIIRHNLVNGHCTLFLKWLPRRTFLLATRTVDILGPYLLTINDEYNATVFRIAIYWYTQNCRWSRYDVKHGRYRSFELSVGEVFDSSHKFRVFIIFATNTYCTELYVNNN
jgi:hypothetical protein